MNSRRSAKRKVSPRLPGSGSAHHKNMIFRRADKKKGGQDEGPKTDAQKLVDRFKVSGNFGIEAMKKVSAMLDGKEKSSQKELSELVFALMEAVEGEHYNARIRSIDFIVKFFGTKDIDNESKKEILKKTDKQRDIPVLTSIVNALKDVEFDIRFYATKALVEAVKNELIEDDVKDAVRLRLGGASASGSPFIRAAAMEGIEILKAREAPEEVEEAPAVEEKIEEEVPERIEEEPAEEIEENKEDVLDAVDEDDITIEDPIEEDIIKVDEPHDEEHQANQMPLNQMVLAEDLKKGTDSVKIKALQNIQKIAKKGDDVSFLTFEIIEMFGHKVMDVRMEASSALKAMGKQTIPALIDALNNNNPDARYEAVWTLGNLRDDSATRPIIDLLINDSNDNVRKAAIEALGKIAAANPNTKSIGIIIALVSALEDKKKEVRKDAVEALGEILENGATKNSRQLIREALNVASKDKDPEVKRIAIKKRNDLGYPI